MRSLPIVLAVTVAAVMYGAAYAQAPERWTYAWLVGAERDAPQGQFVISPALQDDGDSSNGRTADFESAGGSSILPSPGIDYNALIPERRHLEQWVVALKRWDSFKWFEEGCLDGTLPRAPSPTGSRVVPKKGVVMSNAVEFLPLPLAEYTLATRTFIVQSHHRTGFGLFCLSLSESVDAMLVCARFCQGRELEWFEIFAGDTVVLVHETLGYPTGWYDVWMKCADGTDTCDTGWLSSATFNPFTRKRDLIMPGR